MQGFKTYFPKNGHRTDITVTPLEHDCFGIELESTGMEEDRDPTKETFAAMKAPDLVVQKTHTGDWVIIDQGTFELDAEDLKALGRAIEKDSPGLI